jgi:hypothetical protein
LQCLLHASTLAENAAAAAVLRWKLVLCCCRCWGEHWLLTHAWITCWLFQLLLDFCALVVVTNLLLLTHQPAVAAYLLLLLLLGWTPGC